MCYLGCRGRFYIARRDVFAFGLFVGRISLCRYSLSFSSFEIFSTQTVATQKKKHSYITNALWSRKRETVHKLLDELSFVPLKYSNIRTECMVFFIADIPKCSTLLGWIFENVTPSRAPNGIINFLFLGIRKTWNSTFGKTECDTLRVQAYRVVSSQRLPCFHCFGTFVCNCLSLWRRKCALCSSFIVDFIGIFMNSISTKEHAKCTTILCSPT